jgi:hypothetical protein
VKEDAREEADALLRGRHLKARKRLASIMTLFAASLGGYGRVLCMCAVGLWRKSSETRRARVGMALNESGVGRKRARRKTWANSVRRANGGAGGGSAGRRRA